MLVFLAVQKGYLELQTREQAVGLSVLCCDEWKLRLPSAGNF